MKTITQAMQIRQPLRWFELLLLLLLPLSTSCQPQDDATSGRQTAAPSDSATRLQDLFQRYATATHYSDQGRLHLEYMAPSGERITEETAMDVSYHRPNQLRLSFVRGVNRLTMACDGKRLWAAVEDPVTKNLRGQVVQRRSPAELTVDEIYSATELIDPLSPNQMLSVLMGLPLNLHHSQLGLLTGPSAFADLLSQATSISEMPPEIMEGQSCARIALDGPSGRYVFWVDTAAQLLRRIEYPTQDLFATIPADQRPQNVRMILDLQLAAWDAAATSTEFPSAPEESLAVQYFVLPPAQLATELLGQQIKPMTFQTLSGVLDESEQRRGKIQVLTWFDNHPASRLNVTQLNPVYAGFAAERDRVVFRALCVERPDRMTEQQVGELAAQWKINLPLGRDVDATGRDALEINEAPTVVVLDGVGRLHLFEVGANPDIDEAVRVVVQRLLAGEDVAADVRQNWETAETQFQRYVRLARLQQDPVTAEADVALADSSGFDTLQSDVSWQVDDLDAPGHLLLGTAKDADEPQLMVLCGGQQLVELDGTGSEIRRHPLDLDESAFVSQLRRAVDREGVEYYLGFAQQARYVFVFDQNFQRILQYPPEKQEHNGIMDAQLMDLDLDGQLELYVGLAEPHGCQRVDFAGRRVWSNRKVPAALSLAGRTDVGPPHLLAVAPAGWIMPIDAAGHDAPRITVGARAIHQLVACPLGDRRPTQYVGLSYTIDGRSIAVGLDALLQERWSYGLPAGVFRHQVQAASWAALFGAQQGCWLFAGPDGSLHIVADDGRFYDHFNTGQPILGMTGHATDDGGRLYVTTPQKVTAYDLGLPANF